MSEKELDSSNNKYIEKPKINDKQTKWDMAIGLQQVDNLKPSNYLKEISEENVLGKVSIEEVKQSLKQYYIEQENNNSVNHNELECDFVSMRIVELLEKDNFELSVDYLKYIHKYLFQDVYKWAGEIRNCNIAKQDLFCLAKHIESFGNEVFDKLKKENYFVGYDSEETLCKLVELFADINALHPFREGNGRSQRIFIESLAKNK